MLQDVIPTGGAKRRSGGICEEYLSGAPSHQPLHRTSRRPLERRLPPRRDAVTQVEIDEILVRDPCLFRQFFEVSDDVNAKANRHLLFQVFGIGVLAALQLAQIVFSSNREWPTRTRGASPLGIHGGRDRLAILLVRRMRPPCHPDRRSEATKRRDLWGGHVNRESDALRVSPHTVHGSLVGRFGRPSAVVTHRRQGGDKPFPTIFS